jgi:hypothetical protein
MKTFKINDKYQIDCWSENTRYGFRHLANLYRIGLSGTTVCIEKAKVCYYNRTWESFEFETVIKKLLSFNTDIIPKGTQTRFLNKISGNVKKEIKQNFGFISAIAKMGEILCNDQKEKNDWKTRMLKAGLPGLDIPEDWNTLTEEEKEKRLNNVINELQK